MEIRSLGPINKSNIEYYVVADRLIQKIMSFLSLVLLLAKRICGTHIIIKPKWKWKSCVRYHTVDVYNTNININGLRIMKWLYHSTHFIKSIKTIFTTDFNQMKSFDLRKFVVASFVAISVWGQEIYERIHDDLLKLRDVNVIAAWLLLSLEQWIVMKTGKIEKKLNEKWGENATNTPHRWNSSWTQWTH